MKFLKVISVCLLICSSIVNAKNAGKRIYYIKDHLGSTRLVIDPSKSGTDRIIETKSYYPFGKEMPGKGGLASGEPTTETFTGKELDTDGADDEVGVKGLQLHYFGARYYDAEIGRWCSKDPGEQYWSPYQYSINPIGSIDPNGWRDIKIAIYYNARGDHVNGKNVAVDANRYAAQFQDELATEWEGDDVQVQAFKEGDVTGITQFLNGGSPDDINVLMSHSAVGKRFVSDVSYNSELGNHRVGFSEIEKNLNVDVGVSACGAATTLKNNTGNLQPVTGTEGSGSNISEATREYIRENNVEN